MRASRLVAFVMILSAILLPVPALANSTTVSMFFSGPGSNNAGGYYTYPYNFSINGGAPTALICDTFDNEVWAGEHWTATVSGLLSSKGLFGKQLLDYKAAGLIFQSVLNGIINPNVGSFAIWGLFSSNVQNNPYFKSSNAAYIEGWALTMAAGTPNSSLKGLVLYTPVPGTQNQGGTPQEYIGYNPKAVVPEPGTMFLLGTGLIGLASRIRKLSRSR